MPRSLLQNYDPVLALGFIPVIILSPDSRFLTLEESAGHIWNKPGA
jgi:hypothetical protein